MKRLAVLLVGLLLSWLAPPAVASGPVAPAEVRHVYTYDAPAFDAPGNDVVSERGPPSADHNHTTYDAGDRWSRGASPCSAVSPRRVGTDHDGQVRLAQVEGSGATAQAPGEGDRGARAAVPRGGVAAKSTPELASGLERTGSALSKSDPFHRSVSWVIDNPAAQRFGIKGGDGVARDLYQLPGEVNGKSGVFEWIIDRSGSNPVINHQRFIPGGSITGFPNQVVP